MKKGYMCSTDYDWELGNALGGSRVFPSIEDMKDHCSCWKGCGIVEVEVKASKFIHQPTREEFLADTVSSDELLKKEMSPQYIEHLEAELADIVKNRTEYIEKIRKQQAIHHQ
jgi:hypothetical protein